MGRQREHSSAADRQRAYRDRVRARLAAAAPGSGMPAARPRRRPSRPARLVAIGAEIQSLLQEYEDWLASIPESLAEGDQATRLIGTIDQLSEIADAIAEIEPPLGFGRD